MSYNIGNAVVTEQSCGASQILGYGRFESAGIYTFAYLRSTDYYGTDFGWIHYDNHFDLLNIANSGEQTMV